MNRLNWIVAIWVTTVVALGVFTTINNRNKAEKEAIDDRRNMDIALFRVCDHVVAGCAYEINGDTYYMCGKCFAYSNSVKLGQYHGQAYAQKLYFIPDCNGTYSVDFNHNPGRDCFR